jgi:hypothetical protein
MTKAGENWKCPYCGHAQVLSNDRLDEHEDRLGVKGTKNVEFTVGMTAIVCANDACRELSLSAALRSAARSGATVSLRRWTLLPPSSAKPQPDFIPKPIRDDYYEACAICDLSPKASATLIRRCLQGMIRDFCKISKGRLVDEIKELRAQVDSGHAPPGVQPDTMDAIDNLRKIGNIGAHMEADINVIVDVDPDEAHILIELAEALFAEWYVAAEARKVRLGHLKSIADNKARKKNEKGKAGGNR